MFPLPWYFRDRGNHCARLRHVHHTDASSASVCVCDREPPSFLGSSACEGIAFRASRDSSPVTPAAKHPLLSDGSFDALHGIACKGLVLSARIGFQNTNDVGSQNLGFGHGVLCAHEQEVVEHPCGPHRFNLGDEFASADSSLGLGPRVGFPTSCM